MEKFYNVNLITALRAIMEVNTVTNKEDFDIDIETIRRTAIIDDKQDKTLLWLSQPSGTLCESERQIFQKDTQENKGWRIFGKTNERILAYALDVGDINLKTGTVKGNLYELDYHNHIKCVKEEAVSTTDITLLYKNGQTLRVDKKDQKLILRNTRNIVHVKNEPDDPEALNNILSAEKKHREWLCVTGNFKEHLSRLSIKEQGDLKMDKQAEVYMFSAETARENGEILKWRESYKLNKECANAIDEAVKESNYEPNYYDLKAAALKVVDEYGIERVSRVVANAIQNVDYDGRISYKNKEWAKSFYIPDDNYKRDIYVHTHLYIFDGFIDRILQIINEKEREAKKPVIPKINDKLETAPKEEAALFYSENKLDKETGCIGYLRADFGKSGNEFWSTWINHQSELNTQSFKNDLDKVTNTLRKNGALKDFNAMTVFCKNNPSAMLDDGRGYNYGVKLSTNKYSYYLRFGTVKGDYNLYCYAYQKSQLDKHLSSLQSDKNEKNKSLIGAVKEKAASVKNTETKENKTKKNELEV